MNAVDRLYLEHARRIHRRAHAIRNSFTTGTATELLYTNAGDFTALASFTSEASLLAGVNEQAIFQPNFFLNPSAPRRAFRILARGILGTTGTPTFTFTGRLGTTSGSSFLSGTKIFESAAITTGSGVSTKLWQIQCDLQLRTPGIGTSNCTISGSGIVFSPGGFASPFAYALTPSSGESATWTATIDGALTQYLNLSVTCSASSASNTVTLKQLEVMGMN